VRFEQSSVMYHVDQITGNSYWFMAWLMRMSIFIIQLDLCSHSSRERVQVPKWMAHATGRPNLHGGANLQFSGKVSMSETQRSFPPPPSLMYNNNNQLSHDNFP
jgi:hypothetical protein